jgi:TolB-like protein
MEAAMRILTLILTVLFLGEFVHADPAPTSAATSAAPTVLVIPFQQLGDTAAYGWVGQAVQEDLLGQVARTGALQPMAFTKPIAGSDTASALQAGHNAGATTVVFGSYQVVSDQLRVNAQVADVASGRVVGGLQATGDIHDLFKLEDSLSAQLAQELPQPANNNMPTVTYGTPDQGVTPSAPAPVAPDTSTPYADSTPYYVPSYAPAYSYPDYAYPYYYPPVFYGGFIFSGHFHNHPFFHTWNGGHGWSGMHSGGWGGSGHGR